MCNCPVVFFGSVDDRRVFHLQGCELENADLPSVICKSCGRVRDGNRHHVYVGEKHVQVVCKKPGGQMSIWMRALS